MEQLDTRPELLKRTLWEWLATIEGPNKAAIARFLEHGDHRQRLEQAPGSRLAYHDWAGGWAEHERQTMMTAAYLYELPVATGRMDELSENEQFTLSDAFTVMFLHDIEKPFVYGFRATGEIVTEHPMKKAERKAFRQAIIETYGFSLTPTMENALLHVEGVRDEYYVPGERADEPLAALCRAADNLSARAFYDHGRPQEGVV